MKPGVIEIGLMLDMNFLMKVFSITTYLLSPVHQRHQLWHQKELIHYEASIRGKMILCVEENKRNRAAARKFGIEKINATDG